MDAFEQVLRQLRWIKWLVAVMALSFAAIAATVVWMSMEVRSYQDDSRTSLSFTKRAEALLDAGKLDEVLALCDEHEKKFPKDAYIAWYRGRAYYQLGKLPEALKAMRQADEQAPYWREQYTGPFIRSIEKDLAKKKR